MPKATAAAAAATAAAATAAAATAAAAAVEAAAFSGCSTSSSASAFVSSRHSDSPASHGVASRAPATAAPNRRAHRRKPWPSAAAVLSAVVLVTATAVLYGGTRVQGVCTVPFFSPVSSYGYLWMSYDWSATPVVQGGGYTSPYACASWCTSQMATQTSIGMWELLDQTCECFAQSVATGTTPTGPWTNTVAGPLTTAVSITKVPTGAVVKQHCGDGPTATVAQNDGWTCTSAGGTMPTPKTCTTPCTLPYTNTVTDGLQYIKDLDYTGTNADYTDSGSTVKTPATCLAFCNQYTSTIALTMWGLSSSGTCYCKTNNAATTAANTGFRASPMSGNTVGLIRNGTKLYTDCPSGYYSTGAAYRTCVSGTWVGAALACSPSPCTLSYAYDLTSGLQYISGYDFSGSDMGTSSSALTAQGCLAFCTANYPTAKMWLYTNTLCYCKSSVSQTQTANANARAGPMPGNTLPSLAQGTTLLTVCPTGYTSTGGTSQSCATGAFSGVGFVCTDINECTTISNGGCDSLTTCTNTPGSRTCSACPTGYASTSGYGNTTCNIQCASNPCNSGQFSSCISSASSWQCVCLAGFSGTTCQTNINECASNPCRNGATCVDGVNSFTCTCAAGYSGTLCQTDINECASNPCRQSGVCSDAVNGYTCACPAGYSGNNCQTNVNECASSPCRSGGVCTDAVNGFTCACAAGYSGTTCQTNINECASNPCTTGTCLDGVNGYTCGCPPGRSGTLCQTDINECASAPCQFGSTCVDGSNGFTCSCVTGYSGDLCQVNINECESEPCQNGGVCVDGVNSFRCNCVAGYSGVQCQTDVNECGSNPCVNGAACQDQVNAFKCVCIAGYSGARCQTNTNECGSNPCRNGATCVDALNSFSCTCASGYSGALCQTDVNECASEPCANGGSCADLVNAFNCTCPAGIIGAQCQTDVNECATNNGGCNAASVCTNLLGSYECTAYLIPGTLYAPQLSYAAGADLQLSDTRAGWRLAFNISVVAVPYLNATTMDLALTLGTAASPLQFPCTDISFKAGSPVNYAAECVMSAGAGVALKLYASRASGSVSSSSSNTVTYPPPSITAVTLHRNESGYSSTPSAELTLDTDAAVAVQFEGVNFHPTAMHVTYGPAEYGYANYSCAVVSGQTTNSLVTCKTLAGSQGIGHKFRVNVNGQIANGTDKINFPVVPYINSITGCGACDNDPAATCNCPTEAGVTQITIFGGNFVQQTLKVLVNGQTCRDAVADSSGGFVTCYLPEGAGLTRSVTVTCTGYTSLAKQLVSYAAPVLSGLTFGGAGSVGCVQTATRRVSNCPMSGGTVLTLTGSNFGPIGAVVLIGARVCTGVTQDAITPHRKLTCTTQADSGTGNEVLLLQYGGLVANDTAPVFDYHQCAPGEYLDSLQCYGCVNGSISNVNDADKCTACPAGTYPRADVASECLSCPAGSVSEGAVSSCTNCTAGWYQPNIGQIVCQECGAGKYSAVNGSDVCEPCPPGQAQPDRGMSVCSACPIGTADVDGGHDVCPPCAAGSFSNVTGLASCYPCPAGTFQSGTGASACENTAPGYYTALPGASTPSVCPPGTVSAEYGTTACAYCIAGSAQTQEGQSECSLCTAGKYAPEPIAVVAPNSACLDCPRGSYSGYNATVCILCDAGFYQSSLGADGCSGARAGEFTNAPGSSAATPCVRGRYVDVPSATTCIDCPSGSYQSDVGQSTCITCVGGLWAPDPLITGILNISPQTCTAGQYSEAGASSCSACSPGQYAPAGSSQCYDCTAGKYSSVASASCTDCPRGYHASGNGTWACEQCAAGYYASDTGMAECLPCDGGKYSPDPSPSYVNKDCIACGPGFFAAQNASTCTQCTPGFASGAQASECTPCETGKFVSTPQAASCGMCRAGFYANVSGTAVCRKCPAGTYAPVPGTADCTACAAGTFSTEPTDDFPNVDCKNAPAGSAVPLEGMSRALQCVAGEYADSEGQSACSKCAAGTASAAVGSQSPCTDCPAGKYADTAGSSVCVSCKAGSATDRTKTAVCPPCEAGYFAASEGSTSCSSCGGGKYSNATGRSTCDSCVHPFVTNTASAAPNCDYECTGTLYQQSDAQSSCSTCAVQSYWNGETCETCPVGSTCNERAGITGLAGYFVYTDEKGQLQSLTCASCVACKVDSTSSSSSNTTSDSSAAGKANQVYSCCATNFASADGNPLCGSCAAGYNNQGGECIECDEANAPYVLALLALSWAYVLVFHIVSQSVTADSHIFLNYAQFVYLFMSAQAGSVAGWLAIFNLNVFLASGSSCVAPMTDMERLSSGLFIPLVGLAFLMFTCLLHYIAWRWLGFKNQRFCLPADLHPVAAKEFGVIWRSYKRTAVGFFASSYPSICQTVFTFFSCVDYRGDSFIISYPAISCQHTEGYLQWYWLFVVLMIVVAATPILVFVRLWLLNRAGDLDHTRKITEQPDAAVVYGVLFEDYKPDYYYWEVFVLIRRMIIAAVTLAPQFYSDQAGKFTYLTLCTVVFLTIHFYKMPFLELIDNQMEALGELTLIVLTLFLVSAPVPLTSVYAAGLSAMCFVVGAIFVLRMIANRMSGTVDDCKAKANDLKERHPVASGCLSCVANTICCGSTEAAPDDTIKPTSPRSRAGTAVSPRSRAGTAAASAGAAVRVARSKTVAVKPKGAADSPHGLGGGRGDDSPARYKVFGKTAADDLSPAAGHHDDAHDAHDARDARDAHGTAATGLSPMLGHRSPLSSGAIELATVKPIGSASPGGAAAQDAVVAPGTTAGAVSATGGAVVEAGTHHSSPLTGSSAAAAAGAAGAAGKGIRARRLLKAGISGDTAPAALAAGATDLELPSTRVTEDSVPLTPLPPLTVAQATPPALPPPRDVQGTSTAPRKSGGSSGSSSASSGSRSAKLPPLTPGGKHLQNPFDTQPLPLPPALAAAQAAAAAAAATAGADAGAAAGAEGSSKALKRKAKRSSRGALSTTPPVHPALAAAAGGATAPAAAPMTLRRGTPPAGSVGAAAAAAAGAGAGAPPLNTNTDAAITVMPTPGTGTPKAVEWPAPGTGPAHS